MSEQQPSNSGVTISGHNFGAAAAGDHPQAIQTNVAGAGGPQIADILTALAKVRAGIEKSDGVLDPELAIRDVDTLEAEMRQTKRDPAAIRSTFGRLLDRVKPVAAVAAAVYHVKALIEDLIAAT